MNKKQAARARRRATKPEPNMPTVDELVEIGMSKTQKIMEDHFNAKLMEEVMRNSPILELLKRDEPHLKINSTAYKIPFEFTEEVPAVKRRKSTSNNRPKPKDPTYDHKPRKIILE